MPRVCATRAERTPRLGGMRARDLGARGVQKLGTISSTPTKSGVGWRVGVLATGSTTHVRCTLAPITGL